MYNTSGSLMNACPGVYECSFSVFFYGRAFYNTSGSHLSKKKWEAPLGFLSREFYTGGGPVKILIIELVCLETKVSKINGWDFTDSPVTWEIHAPLTNKVIMR